MKYDAIIIGSGAAGLSAAICLAREDKKILILEQHYVCGGWCHSFKLKGHKYTPGIHYIGLLGEGESTSELYKGLGIANDLEFYKMREDAYEHCHIGNERFDIPSSFDEFNEAMRERFPHDKKNITAYLKMVRTVSAQLQLIPKINGFWDLITIPWRTRYLGKYGLFSLKAISNWFVKDDLAKIILNIQAGDHGMPPAKASFPLHAAVMEHYFAGGYYPKGGGEAIVNAMLKSIKGYGAEVQTSAMVSKILLQGTDDANNDAKKVTGVQLENGKTFYADTIISNADPEKTYLDLVGRENLGEKLLEKLDSTSYSCTSLMLFISVDIDVKKLGLDSGNIWVVPNKDMDEVYEDMMSTNLLEKEYFDGMFISCTTLKDPSSFDGKNHVLEVITYINYDAFDAFKNETKKRSQEYKEFKNLLKEKMIHTLEKNIPGIKEHIVDSNLATPLTNEFYTNGTHGNVYGTAKILQQIGPNAFKAKSEIEGLYLCGASILSHGVAGASFSGVTTAGIVLGKRQDELLQHDGIQNIKIHDAEVSV